MLRGGETFMPAYSAHPSFVQHVEYKFPQDPGQNVDKTQFVKLQHVRQTRKNMDQHQPRNVRDPTCEKNARTVGTISAP